MTVTIHRACPFEDCLEVSVTYNSDEIIERDIIVHIATEDVESDACNETQETDNDIEELPF